MTFWSGETIHQHASSAGSNFIQPYDQSRIDCASYKLSMGNEVYITPQQDGLAPPYGDKLTLANGGSFWIPPGQFAFLLTKERLSLPKGVLGFISLATKNKYAGLVNVSGFHVDPGFQGNLVFAVYNAGPKEIRLVQGADIFLIWFADLDNKNTIHNRIDYRKKPQTEIAPDLIQNIRGNPVTLQSVADDLKAVKMEDIKSIKTQLTIIYSVVGGMAAIAALVFGALSVDWQGYYGAFHGQRIAAPVAAPTGTSSSISPTPAPATRSEANGQ